MTVQEEIERLLGRSWGSYQELRGAIRNVCGEDVRFDCFEEWKPGVVIIRQNPVGLTNAGFSFTVKLKEQAAALAA